MKFEFNYAKATDACIAILLAATLVCVLVPLNPSMPAADLESSWIYALNEAMARGFSFGKDIIFTFGPYASIYTRSYHPATDGLMISGSLYLAACFFLALNLLKEKTASPWVLLVCAILAGLPYSPDATFFFYPLIISIVVYRLTLPEHHPKSISLSRRNKFIYLALLLPIGLLPLIKGSLIIACLPILVLSFAILIFQGERYLAILSFLVPLVGLALFWLASGQQISHLFTYFSTMLPVISGYTDAMATDGSKREIFYYLLASATSLYLVLSQKSPFTSKAYLAIAFLLIFFLSFKAGFVRHDAHVMRSSMILLLVATSMPFAIVHRKLLLALAVSITCYFLISHNYVSLSPKSVALNLANTYATAYRGLTDRLFRPRQLTTQFNESVQNIRTSSKIPKLTGNSDVYPYDLSSLIASGNNWSPRPVIQSYSAYTPALAKMNEDHLASEQAPDNIFFKIDSIDNRLPPMDDGASWPMLLFNYIPTKIADGFVLLHKKNQKNSRPQLMVISNSSHELGQVVNLPPLESGALYAQIDVKKTSLGKLISMLFKPTELEILLTLNNGGEERFRVNADEMKSGFLLSPLVETAAGFALLYSKDRAHTSNAVKSISIAPSDAKSLIWDKTYSLKLSEVQQIPGLDIAALIQTDPFVDINGSQINPTPGRCEGNVDIINGKLPDNLRSSVEPILSARGWLAESIEQNSVPEKVFITLTDATGTTSFILAKRTPRKDVGIYFNKPDLPDSGFEVVADLANMPAGAYTFGVAYLRENQVVTCTQLSHPISI